ncbi:MAG: hypothetical protein LBE39_15100 [Flavobacteriaceae bacterium]|jgi:hypothetical protein|nr:hypothetical protein [Flavobacteriaceae bacterium]
MDTTNNNPSDPDPEESLSDKKTKKDYVPPKLNVIILTPKKKIDPPSHTKDSCPNNPPFTEQNNSSESDELTSDM